MRWFGQKARAEDQDTFEVAYPDEEWRRRLTAEQYYVLREHGTERAGTSPLDREKRAGTFTAPAATCRCSPRRPSTRAAPAGRASSRRSRTRSGPREDRSLFMTRTEVHCRRCGGHLGHVFDDGPPPTGLRYCMNGVALTFVPAEPRRAQRLMRRRLIPRSPPRRWLAA